MVLFAIVLSFAVSESFSEKVVFCDNDSNEFNCRKCPKNGVCQNGAVHCNRGTKLYNQVFCLTKSEINPHKFAEFSRVTLAKQNFLNSACTREKRVAKMSVGGLAASFGEKISKDDINYAVTDLFPFYNINEDDYEGYYTRDVIPVYFSMCFIEGNLTVIATGLAIVLVMAIVIKNRVTYKNDQRVGYELYKKTLEAINSNENKRIEVTRAQYLVDSPKNNGNWTARQNIQWRIATKHLDKDPSVIKATMLDGPFQNVYYTLRDKN